jgi:hypothetical protein
MQSTTTQLLTLLNVSALKSTKRKRLDETPFAPGRKLNARNKTAATANDTNTALETPDAGLEEEKDVAMDEDQDEGVEDGAQGEEASECIVLVVPLMTAKRTQLSTRTRNILDQLRQF